MKMSPGMETLQGEGEVEHFNQKIKPNSKWKIKSSSQEREEAEVVGAQNLPFQLKTPSNSKRLFFFRSNLVDVCLSAFAGCGGLRTCGWLRGL